MADEPEAAKLPDGLTHLPLPALPSGRFLLQDDIELFPEDEKNDTASSPSTHNQHHGLLRIHNVGSSLTFLLQVALFTWGIRHLRSVLQRSCQKQKQLADGIDVPPPLLFASLSPMAVKKLVELNPTPYLLIDVRHSGRVTPLKLFKKAINIPETEVRACLELTATEWRQRFGRKKPAREDLILFLSTRGKRAQRAAPAAADLGYNGCCILRGGIQAFLAHSGADVEGLRYLSRDAVALLLQKKEAKADRANYSPWLIDLRRHDERALFGHIKGSMHIPVEEWPKALATSPAAFQNQYRSPKIGNDDIVILHCRTSRSSTWAAYIAQDAGIKRCFVYKEGVFGWRLDPTVLPYDSYEPGDVPPEPYEFELEKVNVERAQWELKQLGLV